MWITEELREDVWSTEANFLITEELVFPLVYMHLRNVERPIVLLLTCNHIYYVEFKRTLTGRLKIFIKPILNIGHEWLFRSKLYYLGSFYTFFLILFWYAYLKTKAQVMYQFRKSNLIIHLFFFIFIPAISFNSLLFLYSSIKPIYSTV